MLHLDVLGLGRAQAHAGFGRGHGDPPCSSTAFESRRFCGTFFGFSLGLGVFSWLISVWTGPSRPTQPTRQRHNNIVY